MDNPININANLQELGPAAGSVILNLEILKKKYEILLNQYNQTQSNYFQYLSQYPPGNYIVNGDFNEPNVSSNSYSYITSNTEVPGWDFNNAVLMNESTAWTYPTPYPNGNQAVSLQNTGSISQSVNMSSGNYNLTFMACGRNCCDGSNASNPINVQLNGTTIYNFQPPINAWTKYTTSFSIDGSGNSITSGTNTISFLGTWNSSDRSSAIQDIRIIYNGLKTVQNSSFLGGSPITINQVDNLQACIASCSTLSNCSGATYNNQQNLCSLTSGNGNIMQSTNSDNIAIVSENLYYLNKIKNLNEQLMTLNTQIKTSINQGSPVLNTTIQEIGTSSSNLNNNYSHLQNQRMKIDAMIKEYENLEATQNESSLMNSKYYSFFIFLLMLCFIFIIILLVMFTSASSSETNSNEYNFQKDFI